MRRLTFVLIIGLCIGQFMFAQSAGGGGGRSRPSNYSLVIQTNVATSSIEVTGQGGGNALRGSSSTVTQSARGNFNQQLAPGTYTITVTAPGYYEETRQVNLNSNQTLTINLRLITSSVTITIPEQFYAKNPNAKGLVRFYDNGELLRGGPVYELTPGQHTLRIESGGLWIQGTFRFEPGQNYTIEPSLALNIK